MNFNEFLNEKNVNEAFEVHYSDGIRAMKKFNNQSQAISFAKDLIKNKKSLQFVDVFNAGSGFHSTADTDAIVAFWGEGSYTDNKSKKDPKLAAKKIEESEKLDEAKALPLDKLTKMIGNKPDCYDLADFVYTNYDKVTGLRKSMRNDEMDFPMEIIDLVDHYGFDIDEFTDCYGMAAESFLDAYDKESEKLDEANKFGGPAGLSKAETKKVAELYAKAISKADGCKCTVNTKTLEEDSFDLDIDGEEYDGGSYNIYDNGDVVNHAVKGGVVYGKKNDSVDTIVKNLKKLDESVEIDEALFKGKDFNKTLVVYKVDIKAKEIYVTDVNTVFLAKKDPNSSEAPERFQGAFGMMLEDDWRKEFGKLPKVGDILPFKNEKALESVEVNEGAVKQFEKDLQSMIKDIKSGFGWIDPEYVEETWENSSDSIDFDLVKTEIYKRLIDAKLLAYASDEDEEEAGKYVKSLKELGIKESVEINESKITVKRQYTENHPAKTVGKHAGVRNKIIEALRDGELTKEEFEQIVSGLTEDSKRWLRRNANFFNIQEDQVSLSSTGKKILKSIDEAGYRPMTDAERQKKQHKDQQMARLAALRKKEEDKKRLLALQTKLHQQKLKKANENNNIEMDKFIYESFSEFVENRLNENEVILEALKSSILAGFIDLRFAPKDLFKAFYNYTKVDLNAIEDEDFIQMMPSEAYKSKNLGPAIVFYVSQNEKANPYAAEDGYSNKTIPAGSLLAIANGQNEFFGVEWASRWTAANKNTRTLSNKGKDANRVDTSGISKDYRGWNATGLSNVKRIAEVSDVAYVLPMEVIRNKYSTEALRKQREMAKQGATALMDAKKIKEENNLRYKNILATRMVNDDVDTKVEKGILTCNELIQKAVKAKEQTQYGEIKVGNDPKGRDVKLTDVTSFMNQLISDYERYVRYTNEAEKSAAAGERDTYQRAEAKNFALSIKQRLAKLDNLNIAW